VKGPARWIVLAAGVVVVVALFVVLRPSGDDAAPERAPSSSPSTTGSAPTTEPTETATPAPDTREIEIEVEEGRVDGPNTVRVERGERVRLVVSADVADEVHVHGYDLIADVAPGSPAEIAFRADAPGVFEVELEAAGLLLVQLQVQA
jgi:heme/copper-type cytochrome/quinol oxidase subunit 2